MRVVLDANVIIAAFAARGLCAEVFEVCLLRHRIVLSRHILEEVEENLERKIKLPKHVIEELIAYLKEYAEIVVPREVEQQACRDKSDLPVLGTALAGSCTVIVTGDSDLLDLKQYRGIRILSPRQFWDYIRRSTTPS